MIVSMQEYLLDQLDEINKFKWILGTKMNMDPLNVFTMNDMLNF